MEARYNRRGPPITAQFRRTDLRRQKPNVTSLFSREHAMRQTFNRSSFVYGVIAATILACFVGAAANNSVQGPKYDASSVMGGLGLQIVDRVADGDRCQVSTCLRCDRGRADTQCSGAHTVDRDRDLVSRGADARTDLEVEGRRG